MENEINKLAREIGLPVNQLRRYLPHDENSIASFMEQVYEHQQAEEMVFVGDLDNVVNMMNHHALSAKSAVSMKKGHENDPWNYTSSEDEEEEEEEEEAERAEEARGRQERSESRSSSEKVNGLTGKQTLVQIDEAVLLKDGEDSFHVLLMRRLV
jgi:ribosomal protein L12E/L44/L45/RPP1/RPP2